ncbi:hypothetical protein IW261DRAFT_1592568 [Armillaria novae-zelandiae]|uniref:Fungal-type protein kinase domain-containing protein n=1 Tax=Armillaria novae-zelandiae TaxID=153914 RepID=A0AA39PC00_9AGAR|nr:hypothetical protein IW261DRAFT_1592568 [Armillaria novae-zelandiae]
MDSYWIGPMPAENFLQTLMGSGGNFEPSSPDHLHNIFHSIQSSGNYGNEKKYAEAVANVVEAVASELIPRLKLVLGEERKDANSATNTVTDAFVYASDVDTNSSPTQWNKAELWLEFKRIASFYGFKDDKKADWVPQTLSSSNYRALGLTGSGSSNGRGHTPVVSRAFDLATEGKYLVEFLYRFSKLTDVRRGKDDTVTLATEVEIALAKELLKPWTHAGDSDQRLFVKIRVPFGRATLGLPVYDIQTETVMFLKDSWRDINLPQESEILEILKTAGVCNVPTFVCGGVISNQTTTTHEYLDKPWNLGARLEITCIRVHQRTLTEEVGHPLKTFKSSKQLTRIVYEAFLGHEEAFTKCKILHRDISGGNILIVYDKKAPNDKGDGGGRGLLNDWDMALHEDQLAKAARQAERTGTWQFMSIGLLRDRKKEHLPQDDFESFIYVMLYHGLRYLRHSKVGPGLRDMIASIFDDGTDNGDGTWSGGNGKASMALKDKGNLGVNFRFDCGPINQWVQEALLAIGEWRNFSTQGELSPKSSLIPGRSVAPAINLATVVFRDHNDLKLLWNGALHMDGWPSNDEAKYQLEPKRTKRTHQDDAQPPKKKQKSGRSGAPAYG